MCIRDSYKADQEKQSALAKEKARIIQKALAAKSKGADTKKPEGKTPALLHCED